jgi:uncharacterized coiled-coil protein SlyX
MSDQLEKRIDRFESKMDNNFEKITEVLTELARHDERVDDLERRVGKSEDDVSDLSKIVKQNENTAKVANRMFWVVFSGVLSLFFWVLKQ